MKKYNKKTNNVVVVGAGWLGFHLANYLKSKGFNVLATCRSQQNQQVLLEQGITTELFWLGQSTDILNFCEGDTCYLINIPFGKQGEQKHLFETRMQSLFCDVLAPANHRAIFVSTTAVYGEQPGVVDEDSAPSPVTESAKIHVNLERFLNENFNAKSTILRLSGLVSGERHPIYSLAKKGQIKQSNWPVNLVHRDDVIRACEQILVQGLWGKSLVLNALEQPEKDEYYRWAAEKCGLTCPNMQPDHTQAGKKINSIKSWKALGIEPCYPTPYDML